MDWGVSVRHSRHRRGDSLLAVTMCSIDWSALGIWAQVVVVASGTIFAVRQYRAFLKNERVKRTLRLLSDFDTVRYLGPSRVEMTASGAMSLVQTAEAHIDVFKSGCADFMAGKDSPLRQEYAVYSDAVVATRNYFTDATRLQKRGLIDKELFLEARSYVMVLVMDPVKKLLEAEGRGYYACKELEAFIDEAREYLKKNPAIIREAPK